MLKSIQRSHLLYLKSKTVQKICTIIENIFPNRHTLQKTYKILKERQDIVSKIIKQFIYHISSRYKIKSQGTKMGGNVTMTAKEDTVLQTAVILPAMMTLVCFICTVMSMTVAAFICLRDKEAREQSDVARRQQGEDEFVSKTITMFYTIRAFNVFRLNAITADKNDQRPAWLGTKDGIVRALHRLGISLTEKEDRDISSLSDVYEIDAEALLYFELERFAKATAMYGETAFVHYSCIQQDGMGFPNLFIPGKKPIYEKDLINTIHKEMQHVTDLFVLLLTGIDAGFLKQGKIPKQFEMCLLKEELCSLEEFWYNYYHRIYSRQLYNTAEMQEAIELAAMETMPSWQPDIRPVAQPDPILIRRSRSIESVVGIALPVPPDPRQHDALHPEQVQAQKNRRISVVRTRQIMSSGIQKVRTSLQATSQMARNLRRKTPSSSKINETPDLGEVEDQSYHLSSTDPDIFDDRNYNEAPSSGREQYQSRSEEVPVYKELAKPEPKLLKNPWSTRRRGKLKSEAALEKNPFIYMVFKVLETLNGKSLKEDSFNLKKFSQVDRNFVI